MQELEKKVMVLNEVAKALGIELCSDGYGLLVKERDKDLVLNLRNGDKETDVFPVPNPHFLPEDISGPRK